MIYADHHAAAPVLGVARRAMEAAHEVAYANPASGHRAGREARRLLEGARSALAAAVDVTPAEVVLTSGGTEACNLGVRGLAEGMRRVLIQATEHPAVLESARALPASSHAVRELPVSDGIPMSAEAVAPLLDEHTLLASQWVNHETGTVFPVAAYAEVCAERGARLFVDASQALGKVPVRVPAGATAMAFAASKMGGPKGAGALFVRRGTSLAPILFGGGQERGIRPGAPDVAAHAGFAAALFELPARIGDQPRIGGLRDRVEAKLLALGALRNGAAESEPVDRVCTVTNTSIPGWRGQVLVAALDVEGVCAASGPACSSGVTSESAVVRAMHSDADWRAGASLRLSFGPETDEQDTAELERILEAVLARRS